MSISKQLRVLLALGVIVTCLGGGAALAAEKVFKLGVLGPFTGAQAKVGAEFKASVELAMGEINHQIGDYKIELVYIDSQMDPAKAVNAYSEAIEKKGIQAGVLNWQSSVAVACMDLVADFKIPHLFGFGATEVVNNKWESDPQRFGYWSAKGWPVPAKLMQGYMDCIQAAMDGGKFKPATKKMAVYGEDTDWGRSAGGAFRKVFQDAGWEVVSEDYFPVNQTDFYPLMSKYKKEGVSVIAGTCNYPAMGAFIKQRRELNVNAIVIADGLGWVGNWYEMTGNAANGVLDMIPQLATPEAKAWAATVEKKYGFKPSPSSGGLSYDGVRFFIKIAKRALETTGELTKDTIYKVINEEVNTGKLAYTREDGAIIMKAYRYTKETAPDPVLGREGYFFPVIQYETGQGRLVYPPSVAEVEFNPNL